MGVPENKMQSEIDTMFSNTATATGTSSVGIVRPSPTPTRSAVLSAGELSPLPNPVSSNATTGSSATSTQHTIQDKDGQHHPVPEFLCQLTKMLTDNNQNIIDWCNGKIRLHDPSRIEGILGKYFRHSKFASFQRQLNYFGFRKVAGKGKLAPCVYTNDVATSDISSLMNVKRKTNGSAARKLAAERAVLASSVTPSVAPSAPPRLAPPPFPFFPMGMGVAPQNAAAAALNTQLSLLALQQQHQQLQQQLVQQQQRAFLEQQQKALIEQHQKTMFEQHREQLRMAEADLTQSLTAASLGQGGNAAASAVVATAATMSQSPPNETKHPATAALEAQATESATAPAPAAPSVQESVANLTSLLKECVSPQDISDLLRQQLPSQSMIFPSMLSLNSFPSRNNSHADLEKR